MFVKQANEKLSPSCRSLSTVLLKRLPIYDNNLDVFAYELSPYTRKSEEIDDDAKRADLLVNTIVNFDLEHLVGTAKIVVPISDMLLEDVKHLPFDKDRVIYQLPDDLINNPLRIQVVEELRRQGFNFAANICRSLTETLEQLPKLNFIKLNAAQFNKDNIQAVALADKKNLIISNIKTREEFDYYCKIGFQLCQGYFLGQSVIYKAKNIGSDLTNLLDVLARVNNPATPVDELEETIRKDVALSYKLLRLINSPYYSVKVSIDSVRQALVLIGQKDLRVWVSLILMSARDEVPSIVSELVLYRAKFCELLAENAGLKDKDVFFTAGMFSGLDLVLSASLESILEKLPLSEELNLALLQEKGQLGQAVKCAKCYESGRLAEIEFEGLQDQVIGQSFETAVAWSYDVMSCF